MQLSVVRAVRRLVAKQISVRARVKKRLIRLSGSFSDRERDGAVRISCPDSSDKRRDFFIGPPAVLPALQDERTVSEPVALLAAR